MLRHNKSKEKGEKKKFHPLWKLNSINSLTWNLRLQLNYWVEHVDLVEGILIFFLSSCSFTHHLHIFSSYSQRMTIQMKGFIHSSCIFTLLKSHMSHNVPALHSREVGCMSIEGFLFLFYFFSFSFHSSQLVVTPIHFPILSYFSFTSAHMFHQYFFYSFYVHIYRIWAVWQELRWEFRIFYYISCICCSFWSTFLIRISLLAIFFSFRCWMWKKGYQKIKLFAFMRSL